MVAAEVCAECGKEISGGVIPRRVLGRVLCPPCDENRIRDLNRRDRVPLLIAVIAFHAAGAAFLVLNGVQGIVGWSATRRIQPEDTEISAFILSLALIPSGAMVAWIGWKLWNLEGRGRLSAILLDGLVGIASVYWLLQGHRAGLFGLLALFSCWYLARSSTADRFW